MGSNVRTDGCRFGGKVSVYQEGFIGCRYECNEENSPKTMYWLRGDEK